MTTFIHGMARTKAALAKVRLEVEAASPEAVKVAGEILASAMAAQAPRNTGRMASSISVDVQSMGDGATAKVGPDVPYARFVEFGTVHMVAQPFEEDAAGAADSPIVTAMASIYKAAIH
jgi:HK97 gp10 family phage protein